VALGLHGMQMHAQEFRIDHRMTARAKEMAVIMVGALIARFSVKGPHHTYETPLRKGIQSIVDSRSGKARHLSDE
jgi:hypothetical protein